jgi:hypothetical protein
MPRPPRIEYAGACYHLMSRGDRREDILGSKKGSELEIDNYGSFSKKMSCRVRYGSNTPGPAII